VKLSLNGERLQVIGNVMEYGFPDDSLIVVAPNRKIKAVVRRS